jgi:hypothetical protein
MKILFYLFFLFSLLTISFLSINCGGSGADTQNYQDPALSTYNLKTVALLPIRNTYLNTGEAQSVNRYFAQGIYKKIKNITVMGPDEAVEQLNKDSLVEAYFQYLSRYVATGIPNTDIIKKIGVSLKTDAIVQGEIFNIIKIDGRYGRNKGETRCNLRYSLISTKDGKLLWETTVESYETTSTTLGDAPSLMEVVQIGMDEIIASLPSLK